MLTVEKQSDTLLNDFSFEVLIEASDFRFYKPDSKVILKLKESMFRDFNNSNCNSKISINVNKIKLIYSQKAIINLLLFLKCFDKFKVSRIDRRQRALGNFRSFIYGYQSNIKDKKQISWINEKRLTTSKKESSTVHLIYYTFLVMIKKEYLKYNISKYLVIGLLRNYRKSIGNEFSIVDYLIESNIATFLNAPTINNVGGMFMSINEIEKHINRAENKKLREFIFHIVKEFTISKQFVKISQDKFGEIQQL
jgi:hypothetical protein